MAALGYDVAAVTGRVDESGGYLRELGAKTLVRRSDPCRSNCTAFGIRTLGWLY